MIGGKSRSQQRCYASTAPKLNEHALTQSHPHHTFRSSLVITTRVHSTLPATANYCYYNFGMEPTITAGPLRHQPVSHFETRLCFVKNIVCSEIGVIRCVKNMKNEMVEWVRWNGISKIDEGEDCSTVRDERKPRLEILGSTAGYLDEDTAPRPMRCEGFAEKT